MTPTPRIDVFRHPLLLCHLARLRDASSGPAAFRQSMHEAAKFLAVRATDGLALVEGTVQTPLGPAPAHTLTNRALLIPVLRAGLAFLGPFLELLPDARIGYLGLARDEETLAAREYYQKLPESLDDLTIFVLDPMLATGGSAVATLERLAQLGAKDVTLVSLVAAPEGAAAVNAKFPHVRIITAALDDCLNDRGFIVPGLGDAGDRWNANT